MWNDGSDIGGQLAAVGMESDGVRAIAAERARQVHGEGWTDAHDDEHSSGELAAAAACYAVSPHPVWRRTTTATAEAEKGQGHLAIVRGSDGFVEMWPWDRAWDKRFAGSVPRDEHGDIEARMRDLAKAGALCAAEYDRLARSLHRLDTAS